MEKPSFKEALLFWLKLGFVSFGGPAGQIAIMHDFLVTRKKWISESRFLHALNFTMLLPGPEAQQLATYAGWLLHGTRGGLVAGAFFVLPSMLILFALSALYVSFGNIPWIYSLFAGLKPAVVAIVVMALVKISSKSLKSVFHYVLAVAAFVCLFFLNIAFPLIIVGSILIAVIVFRIRPSLFKGRNNDVIDSDNSEEEYYINSNSVLAEAGLSWGRLARQVTVSTLVWAIPLVVFYFFTSDAQFWEELIFFFTRAAFVTFGGAYAVLPYVAQVSVEELGWLTELQMIDGLALGETTPGPLVMVLAFVGFMAGYGQYSDSVIMGGLGLVVTTFYTFVPCFFFIFAGAPIIEKTRENNQVKQVLGVVTAAVVGVMLNLTIYLGKAVVFPSGGLDLNGIDWITLAWVVVSIVALYRFKANVMGWIAVSATFGLIRFLILGPF
ncbi:chromate efflux transporter [Puniceicoccaceae bacterium K14]|nr:chromate efflux transporter [Puniceicoccaceae bacterium K14]